jgi:phosphatidate cytidylyltransferase
MDDNRDIHEEPPASRSGRVRIIGAEQAGHHAAAPDVADEATDDAGFQEAELPHWTEPPTGEVPRVLSRESDDLDTESDPWSMMPAPTWREEHGDWEATDESFEPSMLALDETRLGSLDDAGEPDRQPWTFSLEDDTDEHHLAPGEEVRDVTQQINAHRDVDTVIVAVSLDPDGVIPEAPEDFEPAPRRLPLPPPPVVTPTIADFGPGTEVLAAGAVGLDALGGSPPESRRARNGGGGARRRPRRPPQTAGPDQSAEDLTTPTPAAPRRAVPRPRPAGPRPPGPTERDTRSGRNLPVAVASGLALGVIMLVFFAAGTVPALIVSMVVVFLAAAEAYAGFRAAGYQPATLLGLVATISVMIATYNKGQAALPLIVILVFAVSVLWFMAGVERGADPVLGTGATLLVFVWIGGFGSYAALLLNPTLFPNRHGIAFLLGGVITAVAYDVGALAVGAWIGRHPLAPTISPSKTWEGFFGGAVCAVLAGVLIVHLVHPWTLPKAALLGVVVAVVSPLGDLCESLIKRRLGLKDMGRMLPGHGGFLDRVDGLLFVLPATFYLVKAVHLG